MLFISCPTTKDSPSTSVLVMVNDGPSTTMMMLGELKPWLFSLQETMRRFNCSHQCQNTWNNRRTPSVSRRIDLKISPLWSDLRSYNKCNHGKHNYPKPKHEVRMKTTRRRWWWWGGTIVPFCDPAALWEWEEGKTERRKQMSECREAERRGRSDCTKRMVMEGIKSGRARKVGGREGDAGALQQLQVSWKSFSSVRRLCSAMCIWFSRSWTKQYKSVIVLVVPGKLLGKLVTCRQIYFISSFVFSRKSM